MIRMHSSLVEDEGEHSTRLFDRYEFTPLGGGMSSSSVELDSSVRYVTAQGIVLCNSSEISIQGSMSV